MFSFEGLKPVDLSPRLKARAYLVDGTLEEGNTDPKRKAVGDEGGSVPW